MSRRDLYFCDSCGAHIADPSAVVRVNLLRLQYQDERHLCVDCADGVRRQVDLVLNVGRERIVGLSLTLND